MITPAQDYTRSELSRLMKQPRLEWNIESVANSETWLAALPIIPTLLNRYPQSIPSPDMYLEVQAEDIWFHVPSVNIDAESAIERRFKELADEWKRETGSLSFVRQKIAHRAFLQILVMGESALPMLIKEIQTDPNHWFLALRLIARTNPVRDGSSVEEAVAAWMKWWTEQKQQVVYA
jgi:hypothetical protein